MSGILNLGGNAGASSSSVLDAYRSEFRLRASKAQFSDEQSQLPLATPSKWFNINTTASNITWTYTFTSQVSAAYNVYWDVEYVGSNGITFSFTSTNAGSGGSSPPPPPACWTADTLISTPDGPKPFSALKVGDLVLTPLGPRPITDIIHNREKETVYQVRPSVWVTGDQRIRSIPPTETWTPLQIIRSGHSLEQRVEDTWDCKVESGWVRAYGDDEGDVYLYDKTA